MIEITDFSSHIYNNLATKIILPLTTRGKVPDYSRTFER